MIGIASVTKYKFFGNILCLAFILLSGKAGGQIPVGSWRDHLPYNEGKILADANEKVFCATSGGGLFSYTIRDNSIQKYSKVSGLSDADISTIGFSSLRSVLLIGYSNGNIDLIRNDTIYNVPDIKLKSISGYKAILNVYFNGHFAYLACGFGIVLFDLDRYEIKDTYMFGDGGSQIQVNDITSDGQHLFAATAQGIYTADLGNPNLVDFNAWQRLAFIPESGASFRFVAWFDQRLFTVYRNQGTGFDEIITVGENSWTPWVHSSDHAYGYLGEQKGKLLVCLEDRTRLYDIGDQLIRDVSSYYARHALLDNSQQLWVADPVSGLVRINENGSGHVICPDGPAFRSAGDMDAKGGKVWVGGGTEATKWSSVGAYSFAGEDWRSYNNTTVPALEGFLNISKIAIDPTDDNHVMGGSIGYGVVEFREGLLTAMYDETNSILQPVPGYGHGYILVNGAAFGPDGTFWIATSLTDNPVYRRNTQGQWESVVLGYGGFGSDTRIGEILVTTNGDIWLLVQNDGILVFRETSPGNFEERFFNVQNQRGDLLDRVYSIAEDKEGDIWVGSNKGPAVFYDPQTIFEQSDIRGYQPEIPREDGTLFVDFLLATEKINSVSVDGANRKWLTTEKSGVFLVSEDGKKEIYHFTEENSPLLSGNVQTATINDKSGEVFFGTDKGIISFRGEATEGDDDFGNVYVFPNPVRETYNGDITVTGLMKDVSVKITDISGNLVYETTSLGGQAIWNGKNFSGGRVHTGVYLVFCSNKDGSKTRITKLLFIH